MMLHMAPQEEMCHFSVETLYLGNFTPFGVHNPFKIMMQRNVSGKDLFDQLLERCPPMANHLAQSGFANVTDTKLVRLLRHAATSVVPRST